VAEKRVTRFERERAVIRSGVLGQLSELEVKVLFVLNVNSQFDSGRVEMSMESIARDAGVSNVNRARQAYLRLVGRGLARTLEEGGGRGGVSVRELLCPPVGPSAPLFEQPSETGPVSGPVLTGTVRVPVSKEKGDGRRSERGTVDDENRDGARLKTGPVSGPRSQSTHTQKLSHPIQPRQTGPASGPVLRPHLERESFEGKSGGGTGAGAEAEDVRRFLREKEIFAGAARHYATHFSMADAQALWKQTVNAKGVRSRGAYFNDLLRDTLQERQKRTGS
jgi:hypothetical protein